MPTSFTSFLLREIGVLVLCSSVLNFLVRNEPDSMALRAILVFNMAYHCMMIPIVLFGVSSDVFATDKAVPGLVAHLFIGVGSLVYLLKNKTAGQGVGGLHLTSTLERRER